MPPSWSWPTAAASLLFIMFTTSAIFHHSTRRLNTDSPSIFNPIFDHFVNEEGNFRINNWFMFPVEYFTESQDLKAVDVNYIDSNRIFEEELDDFRELYNKKLATIKDLYAERKEKLEE